MAVTVKIKKPMAGDTVPLTFKVCGCAYSHDSNWSIRVEVTDGGGSTVLAAQDADMFTNNDNDMGDIILWKATITLTSSQAGAVIATAIASVGSTVLGVDSSHFIADPNALVAPRRKKVELKKQKPKKE